MKKNKYHILIAFAMGLCCAVSCRKQEAGMVTIGSAEEAGAFLEQQKSRHVYDTKIKEVNFSLRHIPEEQMALMQAEDLSKLTQASFDTLLKAYQGLLFFDLEISIDDFQQELPHYGLGQGPHASFEERVSYYAFEMQQHIKLVFDARDTVPCSMYHYERNYGVSPKNHFMLGFEGAPKKGKAVLLYNNAILGTGPVRFALDEKDLFSHSTIKIK